MWRIALSSRQGLWPNLQSGGKLFDNEMQCSRYGMIKFSGLIAVSVLVIAGCAPRVVPSNQGIGFDNPELRAERDAQLSAPRSTIIPPPQVTSITSPVPQAVPTATPQIPRTELAAAGIGQTAPAANLGDDPFRTQGLDASPGNPAPTLQNINGLSDEQSFDAVAERETIESDAERRAVQAAAREQVSPTAVPERPRDVGPNVVEYAINAPNTLGQEWYSRSLLTTDARFRRNCAQYATPDDAQRDFLARGGPERDRLGIDPDGDGFACGWDPAPFVQAFRN